MRFPNGNDTHPGSSWVLLLDKSCGPSKDIEKVISPTPISSRRFLRSKPPDELHAASNGVAVCSDPDLLVATETSDTADSVSVCEQTPPPPYTQIHTCR